MNFDMGNTPLAKDLRHLHTGLEPCRAACSKCCAGLQVDAKGQATRGRCDDLRHEPLQEMNMSADKDRGIRRQKQKRAKQKRRQEKPQPQPGSSAPSSAPERQGS